MTNKIAISEYSNWVIPDKIICGPYPYCDGINFDEESGLDNLKKLIADGVNTFVCLCSELPDTTKEFNRTISHPYSPFYKHYTNILKKIKPDCKFVYMPIADGNIPNIKDIIEHLKLLLKLIREKNILYIHCAGGRGRTNIYTSILTSILYGLEPEDSLNFVFKCRESRKKRDKKLEIYGIPVGNDRQYIFRPIQEKLVIKICHYIQIFNILEQKK